MAACVPYYVALRHTDVEMNRNVATAGLWVATANVHCKPVTTVMPVGLFGPPKRWLSRATATFVIVTEANDCHRCSEIALYNPLSDTQSYTKSLIVLLLIQYVEHLMINYAGGGAK
jgi:hypothetical protein